MQDFLIFFYILFFATGFMGAAALLLLHMRVRSRVLPPLLVFQLLFLVAMGTQVLYFYLESLAGGYSSSVSLLLLLLVMGINVAVWIIVITLIRRISPAAKVRRGVPSTAEILAWLVIVKTVAHVLLIVFEPESGGPFASEEGQKAWVLGGHIITGLAMAAFGVTARGPLSPKEPSILHPLIRAYGLCAIIFAPLGIIEYILQTTGIPGLSRLSLDSFFYLAWNVVSMSAAMRLFKPDQEGTPVLDAVPEERVRALGLSAREAEMAVMIARGLANKEIAAELNISPATVRTHIYNLYRKAEAGSRVELLNKLRS